MKKIGMQTVKRLIGVMLVIALLSGVFPGTVLAEEDISGGIRSGGDFTIESSISEIRDAGGQFELNVYIADSLLSFADFFVGWCYIQIWVDFDSDVFTLIDFVATPNFILDYVDFHGNHPYAFVIITQAAINAGGELDGRVGTFVFDICDYAEAGDTFEFIVDMSISMVLLFHTFHGVPAVFDVTITDTSINIGDLTGDGRITMMDVALLRAYIMGVGHTLPGVVQVRIAAGAGDVRGIYNIGIMDAVMLRNYAMGMGHLLPPAVQERLSWHEGVPGSVFAPTGVVDAFDIDFSVLEATSVGGQLELNIYIANSGLVFEDFMDNSMIQIWMDFDTDFFKLSGFSGVYESSLVLDSTAFTPPLPHKPNVALSFASGDGSIGGHIGTFIFDICDYVEIGDVFEFTLNMSMYSVPLFTAFHGFPAVFDVTITSIGNDISGYFSCPNFLSFVHTITGVPITENIYNTHVQNITQISASNRDIESLNGIQHFSNIENIVIQGNNLTELDLSGLLHLRHLNASNNNLTTLNISGATALTALSISRNNISTITGLDTLENLEVFWAESNTFASLDFHPNAPLERIDVRGNTPPLSIANITGATAIALPSYSPTQIFRPRAWARLRILSGLAL